jgi:preprotein translocase subunit SecB
VRERKEIKENELIIKLYTKVFGNSEIKNYPFEIEVAITGYFDISENEGNIDFEPNAIAILYPYIRAIISTYTSSANVMPVILPAINVNAVLKNQKEHKEEN